MSKDASGRHEWLSPTRVWRLTECPASVGPVVTAPITSSNGAPNSGSTAHRAVQLWIESDGYRDSDPRSRLAEMVEVALAEHNGALPAAWPRTRARLLSRSSELAELLIGGEDVRCERELQDQPRALRGTPDIVVLGTNDAVVIDLKTQTLKKEPLPPWIVFQLTIYAHLVEHTHGVFPNQVQVFSLNRGQIPIAVTRNAVAAALDTVGRAGSADFSVARPAPDTCRYCRRRLDCQVHWEASALWPTSDCVEGQIERIERAASATAAILVRSPLCCRWVTGIPNELVRAEVGATVRIVRLYRPEPGGAYAAFKWSRRSALAVH